MNALANDWPDTIFSTLLAAGIGTVADVPDTGHARVKPRVLPPIDAVHLKNRLRLALGFSPR